MSGLDMDELKERYHFAVTALENRFFSDDDCRKILKEHFHVMSLEGLGLGDYDKMCIRDSPSTGAMKRAFGGLRSEISRRRQQSRSFGRCV